MGSDKQDYILFTAGMEPQMCGVASQAGLHHDYGQDRFSRQNYR